MRLLPALAAILIGALLVSASPASAQAVRPGPTSLRRVIDSLADAHRGVVGYSITNLGDR